MLDFGGTSQLSGFERETLDSPYALPHVNEFLLYDINIRVPILPCYVLFHPDEYAFPPLS